MQQETLAVATKAATTATYGGSTVAVFAGLTLNEVGAIIGAATAIIGLALQWYFGSKRLKAQEEAYKLMVLNKLSIDALDSDHARFERQI